MRAIYLESSFEDSIEVVDEKFHHFKNVLRLKVSTMVLALDGSGNSREYEVSEVNKKSILLNAKSPIIKHKRKHSISLAIALTKKEALDLSIRMACELGYKSIYILTTENSQKYEIKENRINAIIESSMEQSNSPFKPEIEMATLTNFLKENKKLVYLSMSETKIKTVDNFDNYTLLIGPEAGFTKEEDEIICQNIETISINLKTNILRAQTAVAAGLGYVLNMQNKFDA